MAWLVNIVAADEDEIEAVGESSQPVKEWSGIERRDLDSGKFATLHCLLSEDGLDEALALYEPVYVSYGEGAMVLRMPDRIAAKLAEFDEEALSAVAEELAATEEFELANWPEEEVQDLIMQLADLARLADAQDQHLLIWLHPLRT